VTPHRILLAGLVVALGLVPAAAQPGGEVYAPRNGKFAVKFPGKPKETSQTVKTELGSLRLVTATYADADGHTWWVTYTDYPSAATAPGVRKTLLDNARDGLAGRDGKLVEEKELDEKPGKLPGREVVLDRGKESIRCRLMVKDNRLFQVGLLGPGEFVTGKTATAFLDSFEPK
jgi:hypothetical protein